MWISYLSLFVFSIFATFIWLHFLNLQKKKTTLANVTHKVRHLKIFESYLIEKKEKDLVGLVSFYLSNYFSDVKTEVSISKKQLKEKIDIDIDAGRVGIEIKLAKAVLKANERNRLIGQVQRYRLQKYRKSNLLVLVVGTPVHEQKPAMRELEEVIKKIGASFVYLQTI
jgi:uncharacterized protein YuzE